MFTIESNYSIKKRSFLSNDTNKFLFDLYLPLTGYKSCYLYLFLVNEYLFNEKNGKIKDILDKNNLSFDDFYKSKKTLESLGLIKTLSNENNFIFVLYSPLFPNDFFNNEILFNLFLNKVNEEYKNKTLKKYELDFIDPNYIDISANMNASFELNFQEEERLKQEKNKINLITNNKNLIYGNFNKDKFYSYLKSKSKISEEEISFEELQKIEKLANLYNVKEDVIAYIVIDSFDFSKEDGNKVNFSYCEKRCISEIRKNKAFNKKKSKSNINSNSEIAYKINFYENISPRDFLKQTQNGIEPISSDLNLIAYLSSNLGLSNGTINVILDFCLKKNLNTLNKNYIEKIASSILRNNINNAFDCYNYLFNFNEMIKNKNNNVKIEEENISYKGKNINDISLEELLKDAKNKTI
ncbi:MAG: DnaD domain protein [Bacillales bacterium]